MSFERHGFEFWRLCLFVVIFWPMLRTRARTAVMQACSMGRSLLEREKCSGDVLSRRPEPSQRRRLCAGSGCTAARGEARWKQEALTAPSRAAPWRGVCTVVSLRGPGVASQSPFASRFADPRRVSPHPQQFLNSSGRKSLREHDFASHILPHISLTSCTKAPSACSEPVALQPGRVD